jgi:tubulin polyglutamylase TTLL6/13
VQKNVLFWGDFEGSLEDARAMEQWQFYNHFPGMWKIAHKVELVRNYNRLQNLAPDLYNFHPRSFIVPFQMAEFKSYFNSLHTRRARTFIVKPDRGSQGKGIFIIQDLDDLTNYRDSAVIQEYLPPLLVDGFKFDLRIYALVTSVEPLRVYIHREGMARFCTEPYVAPRASNLGHCFAHLTNFSLNKKSENFTSASKRSLTSVLQSIEAQHGLSPSHVLSGIDRILRLTLISIQPILSTSYRMAIQSDDGKSRLFEILGFDILLDERGTPWLLEVNSMPSLTCGSDFDRTLKHSVIRGALQILDLPRDFKRKCKARIRRSSTQRMSGVGADARPLFDGARESAVAAGTNWRQILPPDDAGAGVECAAALDRARAAPIGGVIETATTRKRKEAVIAHLNERERRAAAPPKPLILFVRPAAEKCIPRTPKSVLIANDARPLRARPASERVPEAQPQGVPFRGIVVFDAEERERIRILRERSAQASALGMIECLRVVMDGGVPARGAAVPAPRKLIIGAAHSIIGTV